MERKIHNIIFDLGGVILSIDYKLTEDAFKELGIEDFKELYSQQRQLQLFDKFETGEITSQEFVQAIQKISNIDLKEKEIINAWNKMLIELPLERFKFLQELRKKFRLFLLSNTNELHIDGFTEIIDSTHGFHAFENLFEKIYYSNKTGLRKPDKKIFQKVIDENQLIPEATLFIDDTEEHLAGAAAVGINVLHLKKEEDILELLKNYLKY